MKVSIILLVSSFQIIPDMTYNGTLNLALSNCPDYPDYPDSDPVGRTHDSNINNNNKNTISITLPAEASSATMSDHTLRLLRSFRIWSTHLPQHCRLGQFHFCDWVISAERQVDMTTKNDFTIRDVQIIKFRVRVNRTQFTDFDQKIRVPNSMQSWVRSQSHDPLSVRGFKNNNADPSLQADASAVRTSLIHNDIRTEYWSSRYSTSVRHRRIHVLATTGRSLGNLYSVREVTFTS